MQEFLASKSSQIENVPADEVTAAVNGMQEIFDRCLGKTLLYKVAEKTNWTSSNANSTASSWKDITATRLATFTEPNTSCDSSARPLDSFLVQIGSFIDTAMPEATLRLLKDCAGRLLDFLAEHPAWFEEEYEPAPASYVKAMALVSA